jgi:hypothetical protein
MSEAEERDRRDDAGVVEGTDKVNAAESGAESPSERDAVDASDLSDTGVGLSVGEPIRSSRKRQAPQQIDRRYGSIAGGMQLAQASAAGDGVTGPAAFLRSGR